jgi:hypothetical protein
MGAWATFDRGAHWTPLGDSLPPVPVYDLAFQEPANALVLGTHGRSIWVLDHIEPLAQLTAEVVSGAYLFPVPEVHHRNIYGGQFWFGAGEFFAPNPPFGAVLTWYLPGPAKGEVQIAITGAAGKTIRTLRGPAQAGLNRACWDLRQAGPLPENGPPQMASCTSTAGAGLGNRGSAGPIVMPGKYSVAVIPPDGAPLGTEVTVAPDPHFPISDMDRAARQSALMSAYGLQQQLAPARDAAHALTSRISAMRQYLNAAGETGRPALVVLDRVAAGIGRAQIQMEQAMSGAGLVQNAIDGYPGLPTGSQLRQLDWAWEDAGAGVSALNQAIQQEMPAVYAALGGTVRWPELKPVTPPAR